jgi:PAS domain S-box-containing protein
LRLCRRSREPVVGTLTLPDPNGHKIPYHCEGGLAQPASETHPALVWLRLICKEDSSAGRFLLLNQKIDELTREITRRKMAELELRDSEQRFRQLADAMPQIVWAARPDGVLDYFNRRWYEYTGFPVGQEGDESWKPILHPDDVQRCVDAWYEAVRSGQPYQIEYRFKDRAAGGYRWHLGRALPVRDGARRIVRWFGTCTDIDAQRRGGEAMRFLSDGSAALATLVDYESTLGKVARLAVPCFADWCAVDLLDEGGRLRRVAVAHVDPDKVELAREAHRRYPPDPNAPFGPPHVARTGQSELVPEIDGAMLRAAGHDEEHVRLLHQLGLRSYMAVPLATQAKTFGVLVFISAESGRHYGAEDLALAEDLARRGAVALDNARLYDELKQADRRKEDFLAMLAHELRNPLAPVRNCLQILRLRSGPDATSEQARAMMERQVQHLVRLVDDLLDLSRIMRGKIELRREPIELGAVIGRAIEIAHPVIDAHGQELLTSLPPAPLWLLADPVRLSQVFANLLNNAAKFTERAGRIWLTAAPEGDDLVLRIRDTGIGIAPDLLPRVFDLFVQVDQSIARSRGGLGIGLTLVKSLVEMHGGRVRAFSDGLGKGSEFEVRLPRLTGTELRARQAESSPAAAASFPRRRVLVVDDNVDAAISLAMLLRMLGHEVEEAHDGPSALRAAATWRPEIVLLDIGLPEMSGYEVARSLRATAEGKALVLAAMTGYGQPEDRRRSLDAGFDQHLTKPVDLAALEELLQRQRLG